jgi:hypothetical protein
MILEVRINKKLAEVHVIDHVNNHPISIIPTNLEALNSIILDLMGKLSITKIKRNRKPLLSY